MSEYKPYLRTGADDFLAASVLGNTVIGVLFDKKGSEIKAAISSRLDLIVKKVVEYNTVLQKVEKFIEEKQEVLKELDRFHQDKCDDRESLILPYRRDMEEIANKCKNAAFDFDKEVFKQISKKAVEFEKGFDEVNFKAVDIFLKEEDTIIAELKEKIHGYSGVSGYSGASGYSGVSGYSGYRGVPDVDKHLPTEEDTAIARINTIKNLLQMYANKLKTIKDTVNTLENERRRLQLISNNIEDDRNYKLDLNKLSALGFEDVVEQK